MQSQDCSSCWLVITASPSSFQVFPFQEKVPPLQPDSGGHPRLFLSGPDSFSQQVPTSARPEYFMKPSLPPSSLVGRVSFPWTTAWLFPGSISWHGSRCGFLTELLSFVPDLLSLASNSTHYPATTVTSDTPDLLPLLKMLLSIVCVRCYGAACHAAPSRHGTHV